MLARLAALAFFTVLTQHRPGRAMTIVLPHALLAGQSASLLVTVGVIQHGAEIEIITASGRLVGVVSPYGIRAGRAAGTYSVPLPAEAIEGRRVRLLVTLDANGKQRAPTMEEVRRVRVAIRK